MFHIARANLWHHAAFAEKIALAHGLSLHTFDRHDDAQAWAALGQADVYQISSARDELPPHLQAGEDLLRRCPPIDGRLDRWRGL